MNCAISEQQQKRFRKKVGKDLRNAINSPEATLPWTIKEYMQNVYEQVKAATDDHELALDYARLVPGNIESFSAIREVKEGLRRKGLSLDELSDLVLNLSDEEADLQTVASYLDLQADEVQELINDNLATTPEPLEPEVAPVPNEEATAQAPFIRKVFNIIGQTLSAIKAVPYMSGGQSDYGTDVRFGATPFYDALTESRNNPNNYLYKVKRNILTKLEEANYDPDGLTFMGRKVYLTAMSVAAVEESEFGSDIDFSKDPEKKGVMLFLTDEYGSPFRFDSNGEFTIDEGGKIAYYRFRYIPEGEIRLQSYDVKRIEHLANIAYNRNKQAAKLEYVRQMEALRDIRNYVNMNKMENMIKMDITGGTKGFVVKNEELFTKIKDLDLEGNAFNPKTEVAGDTAAGLEKGRTYFSVDGFYGQPVELQRPEIANVTLEDGSSFVDKFISILVDDIQDVNGNKLSNQRRRELLEWYMYANPTTIQIWPNEDGTYTLKLQNQKLDLSTPAAKEQAKAALKNYFTTFAPLRKVGGPATGITQNTYTSEDRGNIVKIGDSYYVIERPHLHIKQTSGALEGVIPDINLTTNEGGEVIMSDNTHSYKDFIKNNFGVNYILEGNKLRKYDAYFNFSPAEEDLEKLYGTPVQDAIEETVEENPIEEVAPDQGPSDLPDTIDFENPDDIIDNINNDPEFNKLMGQKAIDKKATKKQIAEAKAWYEKHPLSKYFPFNDLMNAINTGNEDSVAKWSMAGITLFAGADYSDLYHEAWHAFTQAFLTKAQKKALYNEARKKSGGFVDYNGTRVSFRRATDLQLEEYLAEDFRKYMLNGQRSKKNQPERNSIFRKIWNILQALFSNKSVDELSTDAKADAVIGELYEKLRVGALSDYTFSQDNIQFGELNKGIQAVDEDSVIRQLSYQDSKLIVDTIDSIFSKFADDRNSGLSAEDRLKLSELRDKYNNPATPVDELPKLKTEIASYEAKQTYQFSTEIFRNPNKFAPQAYRYAKNRFGQLYTAKRQAMEEATNPVTKDRLKKDAELLYWAYKNFGDFKNINKYKTEDVADVKSVIGYHMMKSEKFFAEEFTMEDIIDQMNEEEEAVKGRRFEVSGNEQSLREMASAEVVYLLKTLHDPTTVNRLGQAETLEFQEVWNKIARTLQNTLNAEEMYARLQAEVESYPAFKQLLRKMGDPKAAGDKQTNDLWTNFWQTFNKTRIPLIQVGIEKKANGEYQANIGEAFNNDTKIGKRWQTEWRVNPNPKYTNQDEEGIYLNTQAIIDDFGAAGADAAKGKERAFLHSIGWTISDNPEVIKGLKRHDDIKWIFKTLAGLNARGIKIRSFNDLVKAEYPAQQIGGTRWPQLQTINSRYKRAQMYEARYGNDTSNFMVTNAEGNSQFEHSLNNSLTVMVDAINKARTYDELINMPHMSHLNVDSNYFAAASIWLNSLFDMNDIVNGRPKRTDNQIDFTNLSGIFLTEEDGLGGEGVASAKADEVTKMILDFHLAVNGQPELMRHADKGTSFSARIRRIFNEKKGGYSNNYISNVDFLSGEAVYNEQAFDYLLPSINAEFKRIKKFRSLNKPKDIDFGYWEQGKNFVQFDDVLTTSKQNLNSLIDSGSVEDLAAYLNTPERLELKNKIANDISSYFAKQVERVSTKFNENSFVADNLYKDMRKAYKEATGLGTTNPKIKDALIKSYVYNSWINNIETINLFYGDLALYNHKKEEFHKRNAGMGSTGTLYRTDAAFQNYINNKLNREFTNQMFDSYNKAGGAYGAYDGTFATAVIKDNEIKSAYYNDYVKIYTDHFMKVEKLSKKDAKAKAEATLKPYTEMNEGDAQGWISFDSYRILKIAEGNWSDAQENMYQDMLLGVEVDVATVNQFFPTVKAQYFGPLQNTMDGLPVTAFHKFSLMPLIPSVIKGTNLETLHNKMMSEGIDYALFESGSKVGTITEDGSKDLFYQKDNDRQDIDTKPFTKNTIYLNYLKNQLEIAPKFKKKVTFPTQLRKLIEDGLYENGKPIKPEYESLVKTYEENIKKLTDIKKKELLSEMDWKVKEVKPDGTEVLEGDVSNLLKFVKKELTRQDLADHEIDFLAIGRDGKIKKDLSLSLSVDKIEKLLNSLVVKRLVKQKVKGEGLVQVSGALFETFGSATDRNYTNPTEADLAKYGTNDLPNYRVGKDGKTEAAKVKVALQGDFKYLLDAEHNDGERIGTRERLNEMIQDEQWLNTGRNREMITMVGVRIPVQGLNSMEFMEIYEFLPEEAGSIIIPPAELVAKSGGDFDIDKLTMMMPNLRKGKRGSFTRMFNLTPEEAKAEYKKYVEAKKSELLKSEERPKINRETGEREIEDFFAYNNLLNDIFGVDINELEDDIENILLEEGDMLTEEEYIQQRIGAKAVENDIIGNIKSILELPENFINLTRPNDTAIVKEIADELAADVMEYSPFDTIDGKKRTFEKGGKKQDMISPTRVFEVEYNLYKHASNNVGKQTLGLGAVDNTYNTVFNRIGFYMNPTVGITTEEYNRLQAKGTKTEVDKAKINSYVRQTILMKHNTVDVKGDKAISLSHDRDVNEEFRIADIINQMMNGWVDIAKDTWIFNIQGNKEVSPTLLFLIQAGVPVKDAIYFASMPMIRDYVAEQRLAKGTFAGPLGKAAVDSETGKAMPMFFRNKAITEMFSNPKYGINVAVTPGRNISKDNIKAQTKKLIAQAGLNEATEDFFDATEMRKAIKNYGNAKKKGQDYQYTDLDKAAFAHFLEIEEMARAVRDIKMRMNFDTSKSGTLFEAQNKILMREELLQDGRIPGDVVDKIITDSPIASFYVQPFQLEVWKDLFKLRSHPALNDFILDKIRGNIQTDVNMTFGDTEKFVNEFRNDLVSFIFQNSIRAFNPNGSHYRGYEINRELYDLMNKMEDATGAKRRTLEKQISKLTGLDLNQVNKLAQGVFRGIDTTEGGALELNNTLFIDQAEINRQYKNKEYADKVAMRKKNVMEVNVLAFKTVDEYTNFVLEREVLRKNNPFDKVKDNLFFKQIRTAAQADNPKRADHNAEQHNKRIDRISYETYLRDMALRNTFNHWALFNSENSYADQFNIIRKTYPELAKNFALVKQLSLDSKANYTNLKLNDNNLDSDMLNMLHESLQELQNPSVIKTENKEDQEAITNFFKMFDIVAFLQSGMNTNSAYSLTRVVPQQTYLAMLEAPVREYVKHLDKADDSKQSPPILDYFYKLFVNNNRFSNRVVKLRGKQYNSFYKLNDSVKELDTPTDKRVQQTKERVEADLIVSEPLGDVDTYTPAKYDSTASVKARAEANPDVIFVYSMHTFEPSPGKPAANTGNFNYNMWDAKVPNTIGLPVLRGYSGVDQLTDVDGGISAENKDRIDDVINKLKEARDGGMKLAWSPAGYGQYMIGPYKNNVDVAKETFLYLSKRLYEEFGYINPKYLATPEGVAQVQSGQEISDDLVKEFMMNVCG